MIKDIKSKINVDKRGKITTGIKAKNERGVEYPKATDYFVIDQFPELLRSYGERPDKLVLFFPSNEIIDFFDVNYVQYGGNQTKIRQCDGEECLHRIKETISGNEYQPGEISDCVCASLPDKIQKNGRDIANPQKCRPAMYMKAFVADKIGGGLLMPTCYLFYSGSRNTAENIYSELKKIRNLAGGNLIGIPFGLSVDMVGGKEDAKQKFPIWNLQAIGSVNQIKASLDSFLFNFKETLAIPEGAPAKTNGNGTPAVAEPKAEPISEEINFNDDFDSPVYWVEQIKAIKTRENLEAFEKEHARDFEMFGDEDKLSINLALGDKRSELKKGNGK